MKKIDFVFSGKTFKDIAKLLFTIIRPKKPLPLIEEETQRVINAFETLMPYYNLALIRAKFYKHPLDYCKLIEELDLEAGLCYASMKYHCCIHTELGKISVLYQKNKHEHWWTTPSLLKAQGLIQSNPKGVKILKKCLLQRYSFMQKFIKDYGNRN